MLLCVNTATCCISCNKEKKRRTSRRVPRDIRILYFERQQIIIKSSQNICYVCLPDPYRLETVNFSINAVKNISKSVYSKVPKECFKDWRKEIYDLRTKLNKKNAIIAQLEDKINELQKNSRINRKYKKFDENSKNLNHEKYEEWRKEIQNIAEEGKSNRFINYIQYKLISNADCKIYTGFSKEKIIDQAEECGTTPERIFITRNRIYRYEPYSLMGVMFGLADTTCKKIFNKGLSLLHNIYAKNRLINDGRRSIIDGRGIEILRKQYWSRQKIQENTPLFAKRLCGIKDTDDIIITNQDATYQFTQEVQSSHEIRKHMLSMHKGKRPLVKVHIWGCTNGKPVYASYMFADGSHSDGKIFTACTDSDYIQECLNWIQNEYDPNDEQQKWPKHLCFKSKETCNELQSLIKILAQVQDKLISDAGYKIQDCRCTTTKDKHTSIDPEGRLTVADAFLRRVNTFLRQVQERINKWCKRNKFCRTAINVNDIPKVPAVWDIALADLVESDVILMKDNDKHNEFVDRILDMKNVLINPADNDWFPPLALKEVKKMEKTHNNNDDSYYDEDEERESTVETNTDNNHNSDKLEMDYDEQEEEEEEKEEQHENMVDTNIDNNHNSDKVEMDCDEEEEEEEEKHENTVETNVNNQDEDDEISNDDDDEIRNKEIEINNIYQHIAILKEDKEGFVEIARGWNHIVSFLNRAKYLKYIFGNAQEDDIKTFIGKSYENILAIRYLRRMNLDDPEFRLKLYKKNPYILKIERMQSKWKSAKKYNIVINLYQEYLFRKSLEKTKDYKNIQLPINDQHWYQWLLDKQMGKNTTKVSHYLHQQYIQQHAKQTKKRKENRKKRRKYCFGSTNFMCWAHERVVLWAAQRGMGRRNKLKRMKKHDLAMLVVKTLKMRKRQNKLHQTNIQPEEQDTKGIQNYAETNGLYPIIAKAANTYIKTAPNQTKLFIKHNENIKKRKKNGKDYGNVYSIQMEVYAKHILQIKPDTKGRQSKIDWLEMIVQDHKKQQQQQQEEMVENEQQQQQQQEEMVENERQYHADDDDDDDDDDYDSQHDNDIDNEYDSDYGNQSEFNSDNGYQSDSESPFDIESNAEGNTEYDEYDEQNLDEETFDRVPNDIVEQSQDWQRIQRGNDIAKAKLTQMDEVNEEELTETDWEDCINKYGNDLNLPPSLEYIKYSKEKSWYDLNFRLFNSRIARIQYVCQCKRGTQLPSCCAHVATFLWLIWYCVNRKNIDMLLMDTPRDLKIKDKIVNLKEYKKWLRANESEDMNTWCFCKGKGDYADNTMMINCNSCGMWWHPTCSKTTVNDVTASKRAMNLWYCINCNGQGAQYRLCY